MLKIVIFKNINSQIIYQRMNSSNLVNCNSRNSTVYNCSQNSNCIISSTMLPVYPKTIPLQSSPSYLQSYTWGWRKSCKKSIMNEVQSIFRTWFSPFLTLVLRAKGGEKEKEYKYFKGNYKSLYTFR